MSSAKKRDQDTYAWLWAVMADTKLSSSSKCAGTVLVLKFKNSASGLCNPGYDAIAKAMGRERRPAIIAVAGLRSRGWLTWSGTAGGSQANTNHFRFLMRPDFDVALVPSSSPVSSTAPVTNTVMTGVENGKQAAPYSTHELSMNHLGTIDKKETRDVALADDWPADYRETFWERYVHKVGKPVAMAKLDRARKRGVPFVRIMAGLDRYIRDKPPDRSWCNPATWLNQARWDDQPAPVSGYHANKPFQNRTDQTPGRATGHEALHIAAMGRGAARRLEERAAAGRDGEASACGGVAEVVDFVSRSKTTG